MYAPLSSSAFVTFFLSYLRFGIDKAKIRVYCKYRRISMNATATKDLYLWREVYGYVLYTSEPSNTRILRIQGGVASTAGISLGQRVESNGRFEVPDGTMSIVVGIHVPYE